MIELKFLSSVSRKRKIQKKLSIEARVLALAELLNTDPLSALEFSLDLGLSFKRNEINLREVYYKIQREKDYINAKLFLNRFNERISS